MSRKKPAAEVKVPTNGDTPITSKTKGRAKAPTSDSTAQPLPEQAVHSSSIVTRDISADQHFVYERDVELLYRAILHMVNGLTTARKKIYTRDQKEELASAVSQIDSLLVNIFYTAEYHEFAIFSYNIPDDDESSSVTGSA